MTAATAARSSSTNCNFIPQQCLCPMLLPVLQNDRIPLPQNACPTDNTNTQHLKKAGGRGRELSLTTESSPAPALGCELQPDHWWILTHKLRQVPVEVPPDLFQAAGREAHTLW